MSFSRSPAIAIAALVALCAVSAQSAEAQQAQEPDAPEVAAREDRLGPVQWQDAHRSLRFATALQLRSTSNWQGGSSEHEVNLHRLRPVLRGSFRDGQVGFKVFLDVAPRALELIDSYLDLRAGSGSFRLGIAKTPFTDYWRQSYATIPYVDWGLTTRYFGGGRQLGIRWSSDQAAPLSVQLGVYTGHTLRGTNGGRFGTLYGGPKRNYLSFRSPAKLDAPHPEFVGQLLARGSRGRLALSAALDARAERRQDEVFRMALDGAWSSGSFGGRAGAYFSMSSAEEGMIPALFGGFAQAYAELGGRVDLALRYASVIRAPALLRDVRDYASAQLALNPAGEHSEALSHLGEVHAQHELTLAATVYQFGHDLKWAAEATWLRNAGPDSNDFRLRIQCQAGF